MDDTQKRSTEIKILFSELKLFPDDLLDILRGINNSGKLKGRAAETSLSILLLQNTAQAIEELLEHETTFYTEVLILARSYYERALNLCYLSICDEVEYRKYFDFVFYNLHKHNIEIKRFDDKGSFSTSLKQQHKGKTVEIGNNELVQKANQSFPLGGKRVKQWTLLKVEEIVKFIGESDSAFPKAYFEFNNKTFYDIASKAIHGDPCSIYESILASQDDLLIDASDKWRSVDQAGVVIHIVFTVTLQIVRYLYKEFLSDEEIENVGHLEEEFNSKYSRLTFLTAIN